MSTALSNVTATSKITMKGYVVEAVKSLNAQGKPAVCAAVLKEIKKLFGGFLTERDFVEYDRAEGTGQSRTTWEMTATHAATDLRAEGILGAVIVQGDPWYLTGTPYISAAEHEKIAVRQSTCEIHTWIVKSANGTCSSCDW